MRRYTAEDEQRIRMQARVRDWMRAGLLRPEQGAALAAELRTDLKRTNELLRAALALFTAVIVLAFVTLLFVSFEPHATSWALTLALVAVGCVALAEYLVAAFGLYRYGVEEVLACGSVLLLAFSVGYGIEATGFSSSPRAWDTELLLVASAGGFAVYRRYGLVYAAVGAMIGAALIPFQWPLTDAVQRSLATVAFGAVFAMTRAAHRRDGGDFPGDEYDNLQAAACAGLYLALNLHVTDVISAAPSGAPPVPTWFYWSTYAATWLIPTAALTVAIREKDRALLTVGIVLALCTLVTNKPYLGWTRQTWDPMLLGVVLIGGAIALRRWLASGPDGQRGGFTPARILERDRDILSALATASVAWHGRRHEPPPAEAPGSDFAGGRSGGAGGGAGY